MNRKPLILAILYFVLATLITWWFIKESPLYTSQKQQLLSCGIAGGKWAIQILAALIVLKERRWVFIKDIGMTAFAGSIILLPYAILGSVFGINGKDFFLGSLTISIALMVFMYAISVRHSRLHIAWWLGWLICLSIAIILQLRLIFDVL
jgi:hypothetical protein